MILTTEIQRVNRLHELISFKATGTPDELAEKLNIGRRQLFNAIEFMKDIGAPICYNKYARTYYYNEAFDFEITVRLQGKKVDAL